MTREDFLSVGPKLTGVNGSPVQATCPGLKGAQSEDLPPLLETAIEIRSREVDHWNDCISSTFVPLRAAPVGMDAFSGDLRVLRRGQLLVASIAGSAQEVRRGPQEIATGSVESVYLNLQLSGVGQVRARPGEMETAPGAAAIVASEEAFTLRFDQPFRQLCVAMPADWIADRLGFPATALQRRYLDTTRSIGRIVRAAIAAFIEAADEDEADLCGDLLGRALTDVMRGSNAQAGTRLQSDSLLIAIQQLIRHRLAEVDLTPARAATALGCSLSTLHLRCQRNGQSFSVMLRAARLDMALELLRSTQPHYGRVEAVAFACGFADPSHFARVFKARFGLTPSRCRSEASDP